ncbi:SIMPL domain-containing protein [Clostridium tetani]|uniref:SIMPL domain-containing protein n=1 Tax=Clostridium tetani TaxID=1513 RepID=UPI0006908A9B|nr:SIMPL domain-containing protein [Clostridium tetani]SUY66897.1 periplasmic immunogenic protein [Clostridium tetani]
MYFKFYNAGASICNKGRAKVIGVGSLKVQPDMAIVSLGIITEDKSLEKAQRENAKISDRVIRELQNMGIDRRDISTANYNIEAQYDYVDNKRVFRGYRVTNILSVNIRDITKVGEIIDASVKNGANNVGNVSFTISNPKHYNNRALKLAVENAVEKAMVIGNTLKVQVNTIPCSVKEVRPTEKFRENTAMFQATATTPIMPGELTISATVEAIFVY